MGGVVRQFQTLWDAGAIGALDDSALLDRFLRRDQAAETAFEVLVRRHGPMVSRVCRDVLGDPHDAQDAAQATFLILAQKAGSVHRGEALASWLFGTARRVAANARRDVARRRRHERMAAEGGAGRPHASEAAGDRGRAWPELHEELVRLPARYRAVIVLCDLEGLTHEQAAGRLGRPLRTIQTRLYRGRERLRSRLIRRGLAPAAALVGTVRVPEASAAVTPAWSRAAVRLAGGMTAGEVPVAVMRMVRTGAWKMNMVRLKLMAAIGLVLGTVSAGAGFWMHRAANARPLEQTGARGASQADEPARLGAPLDAFERTYVLLEGEDVKAFTPPARDARIEHELTESRRPRTGGEGNSHSYFRWRDGTRKRSMQIGSGNGPELRTILLPVLGMHEQEAEGDQELLKTPIIADFLVRDRVPPEKLVPQFQAVLRRDLGLPVKLTLYTEMRESLVVGGRYRFKPDPGRDHEAAAESDLDQIEIYAREIGDIRDLSRGLHASGDFAKFLSDLAKHTGLRVVNEAEAFPSGMVAWHVTDYTFPVAIDETDRELTLKHLAEQTGLTFRMEKREVRILGVERDD